MIWNSITCVLDQTSLRVIQLRTMDKIINKNCFFKITLPAYVLFPSHFHYFRRQSHENKCHGEIFLLFSCKDNGVVTEI
jgi:hypothetical protein